MKKTIGLLGVSMMLLASCATYQKTAPVMGVQSNNINTYVAADLDYANAKKVEATINTKTALWFIALIKNGNKTFKSSNRYSGLSKQESQALYLAKEQSNVDIILEPEFEKESHSWFFGIVKTCSTKVKGWGINVKGIKEDGNRVPNAQLEPKKAPFAF